MDHRELRDWSNDDDRQAAACGQYSNMECMGRQKQTPLEEEGQEVDAECEKEDKGGVGEE